MKQITKYLVYNRNYLEKVYKHKIQAYIYCMLKGYIYSGGRFGLFLDPNIKIHKVIL